MIRIAYVTGRSMPHNEAFVHIEDHGYQFVDGVYEIIVVYVAILIDCIWHIERVQRSLSEIRIITKCSC